MPKAKSKPHKDDLFKIEYPEDSFAIQRDMLQVGLTGAIEAVFDADNRTRAGSRRTSSASSTLPTTWVRTNGSPKRANPSSRRSRTFAAGSDPRPKRFPKSTV